MRKYLTVFYILTILSSCKPKETKINALLNIIEDKNGNHIRVDDFLALTWSERTEEGKLISSSGDYDDRPAYFSRRKSDFKGDFFDRLGFLSEGDSAEFKVSVDSLRIKLNRSINTKGKYLIYNVRVHRVIGRGNLNDSLYNVAIEGYREKLIAIERVRESQKIEKYINTHKLNLTESKSGFKYKILEQGKGSKAVVNDTVLVNYTAETLTGKIFETNNKVVAEKAGIFNQEINYFPVKVPVKKEIGLSAFLQATTMFPKGTKVMLVIPSALAYGGGNYSVLKPYSPLVCNLEIVDILHQKNK